MIDPAQQSLVDGARALAQASARARTWVHELAQTATSVANEEHSLLEATRRSENLARKMAGSAGRRNSAGVFGPSQAGKSYLVSVLGKSQGKPLMVDFAGTLKSFIQDLNPAGGKEATGLVTRFTTAKGTSDSAFPVELRLLSETDLVKILGNSFLSDFNEQNRKLTLPDESEVRDVISRLEGAATSSAPHVDEISMFDIGEYFKTNYSTSISPLTRAGYWDALTRFGHRLPTAQRVEMYSLLWGGARGKDITDIFAQMQAALEKLGHAANARAGLDCLLPRDHSIIDVHIVQNLLGTEQDLKDLLKVVPIDSAGREGRPIEVPRATLCALVAELLIVVADQAWPFFEHTDLLDFPGARSREQLIDLPTEADKRAEAVRTMVRRGKVSYLFQRYTEERELACMLLCMPPSNAEVKDLSSLVRHWVWQTHGDSVQARSKLDCALFFVLTKFNTDLEVKSGDTPESLRNRMETRLEASMYQLYKQEEWIQNWNGQPFNNTFLLRDAAFPPSGVFFRYEGTGAQKREIGIDDEALPTVETFRTGILEGELSRKHFRDPARAWEAGMKLNDGGLGYLVECLEKVLSPRLKTQQLVGRLVDQGQQLDARLRRFYQADDDSSRKEKETALLNLRRQLFKISSERSYVNFTQLMSRLKLEDADIREVFLNVASLKLDAVAAPVQAVQTAPVEDDPWGDPWGEPQAGGERSTVSAPLRQRDRFDIFSTQVLNLWTDRVRELSTDAQTMSALGMSAQLIGDIGNELVIGAHRSGLADRIADRVRQQVAAANVRWDEVADRCAGIATMLVNDYVTWLGFAHLDPNERPAVPEAPKARTRGVFQASPMPGEREIPSLSTLRAPLERDYFMDWGIAFRQLGLDNVSFSGGREIGEEHNRQLGEILAQIEPALQARAL